MNETNTEWTIPTLKALLEQRMDASDKALELQAQEYERRLDILNHDHENTKQVQLTYVSIAVYDAEKREWDNRVRNLEKFQNNLTGRLFIIGAIVMLLAALLGSVLTKTLTV